MVSLPDCDENSVSVSAHSRLSAVQYHTSFCVIRFCYWYRVVLCNKYPVVVCIIRHELSKVIASLRCHRFCCTLPLIAYRWLHFFQIGFLLFEVGCYVLSRVAVFNVLILTQLGSKLVMFYPSIGRSAEIIWSPNKTLLINPVVGWFRKQHVNVL